MVQSVCVLLNLVKNHDNQSLSKYVHQLRIFYCQIFGMLYICNKTFKRESFAVHTQNLNLVRKKFVVVK